MRGSPVTGPPGSREENASAKVVAEAWFRYTKQDQGVLCD